MRGHQGGNSTSTTVSSALALRTPGRPQKVSELKGHLFTGMDL